MQAAPSVGAGLWVGHTAVRAGPEFPAGLIGGARRYWTRAALVSRASLVSSGGARVGSILAPSTGAPDGGQRFPGPHGGDWASESERQLS